MQHYLPEANWILQHQTIAIPDCRVIFLLVCVCFLLSLFHFALCDLSVSFRFQQNAANSLRLLLLQKEILEAKVSHFFLFSFSLLSLKIFSFLFTLCWRFLCGGNVLFGAKPFWSPLFTFWLLPMEKSKKIRFFFCSLMTFHFFLSSFFLLLILFP